MTCVCVAGLSEADLVPGRGNLREAQKNRGEQIRLLAPENDQPGMRSGRLVAIAAAATTATVTAASATASAAATTTESATSTATTAAATGFAWTRFVDYD